MVLESGVCRVYRHIILREDSYDNCELSAGVTAVLSQCLTATIIVISVLIKPMCGSLGPTPLTRLEIIGEMLDPILEIIDVTTLQPLMNGRD